MKRLYPLLLLISMVFISCTDSKKDKNHLSEIEKYQSTIDSLNNVLTEKNAPEKNPIATFLTFQDNNAENAMNFYVELFDNSEILEVKRWGAGGPVEEGKIMHAIFKVNGRLFMCSDSPPVHEWDFSPAVSNFIQCENESDQNRFFNELAENGNVLMPLDNYGFSKKFGWVIDQFGVSWQLNLD